MAIVSTNNWMSSGALLLAVIASVVNAEIQITEIADKGSWNICNGNDWLEIHNTGDTPIDLSQGYLLHDDKGPDHDEAYRFPPETPLMQPNEYRVLCTRLTMEQEDSTSNSNGGPVILKPDPLSPQFGIGGDDKITLLQMAEKDGGETSIVRQQPDGKILPVDMSLVKIVDTVGPLPNTDDRFDVTYALHPDFPGQFNYTSTPTPGAPNVITRIPTKEEYLAQHRAQLQAQDELGRTFFDMDERGYRLPKGEGMDDILELRVTMTDLDYAFVTANRTYEINRAFTNASIWTKDGTLIKSLDSPGKIRPKGQSTLFIAACLGTETNPWQIDFDAFDNTQTLFGVERAYLRHHMGDYSYMRDYAYNRMLARFGLPYLRARKVHFYINNELKGLYTLMEAPDQEYTFARNFPNYNPESYALYKIKSMSLECGIYTQEEIAKAQTLVDDPSLPPYSFQRGYHKPEVKELGLFESRQCIRNFREQVWDVDFLHVVVAYLRYDEDCGDALMGEGLIDRDLGTKNWDKPMKQLIRDHLSGLGKCGPDCEGNTLKEKVDIENFLKSFAFYAVTMNSDSPLVNGNNYYLAQSGDEDFGGPGGWKVCFHFWVIIEGCEAILVASTI